MVAVPHGAKHCVAGGKPHIGPCVDPATVASVVEEIARLKADLEDAYALRRELIHNMVAQKMSRRRIGDFLGVSNVLVSFIVNGGQWSERGKKKVQR